MTKEELLKNGQENDAAGSVNLAEATADNTANQESSTVQQTQNYLQQLLQNKPTDFNSKYLPQLETLYDKVMNRDKFSYDVQSDPLYQQYKNQYAQMGQLAMQDTIGNAAALTGGYGNSWAATAGNQAYQNYLQQLNDKVPTLYESAYNRYVQEGKDLQNQLSITSSLYDDEYSKYTDDLNYMQKVQQLATDERTAAYNQAVSMMQMGMTPSAELLAQAGLTEEDVKAYKNRYSGSGSGSDTKKATGVPPYNYALLSALETTKDGGTPTNSQLAAAGLTREEYNSLVNGANKAANSNSGAMAIINANKKREALGDFEYLMLHNAVNSVVNSTKKTEADKDMDEIRKEFGL